MTDKQWAALAAPIEQWAQALEKYAPRRPALSEATWIARAHVVDLFHRMESILEIDPNRKFNRLDAEGFMSARGSGWVLRVPKLRDAWFEATQLVEAAL